MAAERVERPTEADEVAGNERRSLVNELVEGVGFRSRSSLPPQSQARTFRRTERMRERRRPLAGRANRLGRPLRVRFVNPSRTVFSTTALLRAASRAP